MDAGSMFVTYWERELPATRKVLSRIPEGSTYRPDPKARTAREIAWVIVQEEILLVEGLEKGKLEWRDVPAPATMKEVVDTYERQVDAMTRTLKNLPASRWDEKVPFTYQGHVVMNTTGFETAWGFLLDIIHHRGQLSTYLRPMGATVPQIYGPTADEPM
jgi:uncharacterized damage-inducible protein DinB